MRGRSFQVVVFADYDLLAGRELRLCESTTDEGEAKRILWRLTAQVAQHQHAKARGSFRTAMDEWLRVLDVEESTRESYEQYARTHLYPAFGDESIGPRHGAAAGELLRRAEAL